MTRKKSAKEEEQEEKEEVQEAEIKRPRRGARTTKKESSPTAPVRRSSRRAAKQDTEPEKEQVNEEQEKEEEKEKEVNEEEEKPSKSKAKKPRPTLGIKPLGFSDPIHRAKSNHTLEDIQKTKSAIDLKKLNILADETLEEEIASLVMDPDTGEVADRWLLLRCVHFSFWDTLKGKRSTKQPEKKGNVCLYFSESFYIEIYSTGFDGRRFVL